MTISEVITELESLAQETEHNLHDLNYSISASGEHIYAPWEHTREKQVCLGIASALTDLQNILQDSLLSDQQKQDCFLSEVNRILKRWRKLKDPDSCISLRKKSAHKLLELTCFFNLPE